MGATQAGNLGNRGQFDRARLPDPISYYTAELEALRRHGANATARCPFHDDRHPSLSVNLDSGAFRCRVPACGAHGRDVLAFHMVRYGLPFVSAAKALGAWRTRT
jgi:DNA primase